MRIVNKNYSMSCLCVISKITEMLQLFSSSSFADDPTYLECKRKLYTHTHAHTHPSIHPPTHTQTPTHPLGLSSEFYKTPEKQRPKRFSHCLSKYLHFKWLDYYSGYNVCAKSAKIDNRAKHKLLSY